MRFRSWLLILFVFVACYLLYACNSTPVSRAAEETIPEKISYNFNIRPIFSDKCFNCHGPDANKREAGLRLDIAEEAYKALKEHPGAHGLVPGSPQLSEVFKRISSKDTSMIMPPISSKLKLTQHEVELIGKWIEQGAKYERHWSFTPPKKVSLPKVDDAAWPKNEIDYFVLAKLEQKGLKPNPEADKERLLKRLSLDLIGLPPTIAMTNAFLADKSDKAYEKVVDKLLADSGYGEKMAQHWLDVARYADSHGYQDDNYRSQWPWRDWVIYSFNNNMPYNRFITEQIAGDLMPDATKETILATGFNRNHKYTEEGGVIDEEYRVEYVTDRTNTFSKALLGVTMECAHCHDHKYDPFSQKEYYQLFSFFNSIKEKGYEGVIGGPETWAKNPKMEITNDDVRKILRFVKKPDTSKLIVSIMADLDTPRTTYVLKRGVYDAHGDSVLPGTPKAILPFNPRYPKNRLGLTEWLFDKNNPLTARVFVNQMWQEIFGRGIVKSAGDFGMQGDLPSHPELLDWLAVDFRDHGWNIKRLMKQLVMSATYRQSTVISAEKLKADPENIYLARAPRSRLQAEFVRDLVLSSSGLLVRKIGGPSVKPYQPTGLWEQASSGRGILKKYRQDHGANLYRRGIYSFIKRTVPPAVMGIFDASNRDQCEVKRLKTNTPLQALVMMNDPTVLEAARVFGAKLVQENSPVKNKVDKAFRTIVCRRPTVKELDILTGYYQDEESTFRNQQQRARQILAVGEYPMPQNINISKAAAMMEVLSTIYNLEETITKS